MKALLVEDTLSMIRAQEALGSEWTVLCLLGTHLSSISQLPQCEQMVIWLDEDAVDKAVKLQKRIGILNFPVKMVKSSKEPKQLPDFEIKRTVYASLQNT